MTPAEPSDDDLLAATARGEERAFGLLVARHAARARALAYRLTGNAADADDMVQDAFSRAFAQAAKWRAEGVRFSTWLHRVIVNQAADEARKRKIRRPVALEDALEPADERPLASEAMEASARAAALRQAIDGLPERQRQAVVLTYGSGLPNAEVAAVLGISVEAVEAALTRARASLKMDMRRSGWIEEQAR